jgi:hypothetical protein
MVHRRDTELAEKRILGKEEKMVHRSGTEHPGSEIR